MKVSVIVPVFNSEPYLTKSLESILSNANASFELEILVIDDCSTDVATLETLSKIDADPRIKVLYNKENSGPSKARNAGLLVATGDWITFLDSDDLLAPNAIAVRLQAIAAHPGIEWLAGDMLEMRKPDEPTHQNSFSVSGRDGREVLPGIFEIKQPLRTLVTWSTLPTLASMMLSRELAQKVGLFDERLMYGEDLCFCFAAAYYTDLYWMQEPTIYIRRHHVSMTKDKLRLVTESPRYTRKLLRDSKFRSIHRQLRWQHAASLRLAAKVSLAHDLRFKAIWAAVKAVAWTPNDIKSFRSLYFACFGKVNN